MQESFDVSGICLFCVTFQNLILSLIFADGTQHDADFCHEQCGEDDGKDAGGGHNMTAAEAADACIHRQQSLDGPGLTAHFSNNPSALSGNVHAWESQQGGIVEESEALKLLSVTQPQCEEEDEDDKTTQTDHQTERPIHNGDIGDQVFGG